MGIIIRKREDVKPLCPMKRCFCFDNRLGTFLSSITVTITALLSFIFVILDLASWTTAFNLDGNHFEIKGGYPNWWRKYFWKGFVAVDIVMAVSHLIIVILSLFLLIAIALPDRFKIYRLKPIVESWYVFMILYMIIELGVNVYTYSWFGLAAWRLPYIIFLHMFYIIRFLLNIMFIVVGISYATELNRQLHYSTEDDMAASTQFLFDTASGIGTHNNGYNKADSKAGSVRDYPPGQQQPLSYPAGHGDSNA